MQIRLRKGEAVIFKYQTNHAATPNLNDRHHRALLYTSYSLNGVEDWENHVDSTPSIYAPWYVRKLKGRGLLVLSSLVCLCLFCVLQRYVPGDNSLRGIYGNFGCR